MLQRLILCIFTLILFLIVAVKIIDLPIKNLELQDTPSAESQIFKDQKPEEAQEEIIKISDIPADTFLVKRVIDGDTIELEDGTRVRYIGIDTPETVNPNTIVECFGEESSKKNKELVQGKNVTLESDISDKDRFGRLLRYVYVGDVFVNEHLVREGYAYSSSFPPDIKFQDLFKQAEKEARDNNKGLWRDCENN